MLGVRGPGRGVLQPARGECRLPGKPRRTCCKTTFIYKDQQRAAGKPRPPNRLTCDDAQGRRSERALRPCLPGFPVPTPRLFPWLYRCFPDGGQHPQPSDRSGEAAPGI